MAHARSNVALLAAGLFVTAALVGLGGTAAAVPARAAIAATTSAAATMAATPEVQRFTRLVARRQALVVAFHPL